MNQNKDALYAEDSPLVAYQRVFNWFKSKLSVNHPNEPITHFTYFFDSEGSANYFLVLIQEYRKFKFV